MKITYEEKNISICITREVKVEENKKENDLAVNGTNHVNEKSIPEEKAAVTNTSGICHHLILDCSSCTFLDLTGLNTLNAVRLPELLNC